MGNDEVCPKQKVLGGDKINLKAKTVRDLWRQKDIAIDDVYIVPPHGVLYVKVANRDF